MGERPGPSEVSLLEQSRDKANVYLKDGRLFVFQNALDYRLGLGSHGINLAVSFSASHFLDVDMLAAQKDLKRTNSAIFVPGFLKRHEQEMVRVLDLAGDYLKRERERYVHDLIPNQPEEFTLAVRQAVQSRFLLEDTKNPLDPKGHRLKIDDWGTHWKAQIAKFENPTL